MGTETKSNGSADGAGATLRLLYPQWQGAGTSSVRALASEFPFEVARRGYAVGSAVLAAVLPPNQGPTATVPIAMGEEGLERVDGVEAKAVLLEQLARALGVIERHGPTRIVTLGGECAVSVAPFSALGTATATTWRSCGSTPTRTSAPRPASTPDSTPWPLPR